MSLNIIEALEKYLHATNDEYRPIMLLPKEGGVIIGVSAERSCGALNKACSVKFIKKYFYGIADNKIFFVFKIEEETLLSLIRNTIRQNNPDFVIWVTGKTKNDTGFIEEINIDIG